MVDKKVDIDIEVEIRELRKLVDALVIAKGGWTMETKKFFDRQYEIVNKHRRRLEIEEKMRLLAKEYEEIMND